MNEVSTGEPGVTEKLSRHQPHPSDMTASVKSALWGLWVSALLVFRAIEKESRQTPLSAGGAAAAPRARECVWGFFNVCLGTTEQEDTQIFSATEGCEPPGKLVMGELDRSWGECKSLPPLQRPPPPPTLFLL